MSQIIFLKVLIYANLIPDC